MADYKEIDEFLLEDCQGKFKDKSWFFGMFGSKIYTPTGEKIEEGYRYFACDVGQVVEAFRTGNLAAMQQLPFALDEDGDPDTSSVLISLYYTPSGSAIAMQVEQYQNHDPRPVTPVVLLEGAEAQARIAQIKELDQTN
jgi:hypothetical protein